MIDEAVVKRYAEAFADFARGTIGLERALKEFSALRAIMRDNPGFQEILETPQLPLSEKHSFLNKVLAQDFSPEFMRFLELLLEKRRINKIADIAEYLQLNYAHKGQARALLKTSFPLDLEVIQQIKDKLEEKFRKKFRLYIDLDAELLGGVQVVIGNKVIDGSVRKRLEDLREKLKGALV
jgi:F-type H+-transporting ATPase subunit delta